MATDVRALPKFGSGVIASAAVLAAAVLVLVGCGAPDSTTPSTSSSSLSHWMPAPGTQWQIQLSGTINTSIDTTMYDIDLFDTPQATIDALRAQGHVVICYFSAGSYENWRPDASRYPSSALGRNLDGWPGERWVDIRSSTVRSILRSRMDLAVQKHCTGVDPDNVDGYANRTGFPLSASDQLSFNQWLANEAHARGLAVGLKNDLEQVPQLVGSFDWSLDEECVYYQECDRLMPFIQAGKAVFHIEYTGTLSSICSVTQPLDFSTLKKMYELSDLYQPCP